MICGVYRRGVYRLLTLTDVACSHRQISYESTGMLANKTYIKTAKPPFKCYS